MISIIKALGVEVEVIPQLIIGLILLIWLLWKKGLPPAQTFLEARRKGIEETHAQVEQTLREIEEYRSDYRQRLDNIKAETDKSLSVATAEAEAISRQIHEETQHLISAIQQRTEADIKREHEKLLTILRREMVEVAFEAAEDALRGGINETIHHQLIGQFINDLAAEPLTLSRRV